MTTLEERQRGSVYKSLETDDEFIARIQARYAWWQPFGVGGHALDDLTWVSLGMQRRIVEREIRTSLAARS